MQISTVMNRETLKWKKHILHDKLMLQMFA